MSEIGKKIKEVFGSAAVYKDPANYEVFNGRNLPSFVKDYLISTHIGPDGTFRRDALDRFLDAHIPKDNSAILARLRRGETLTLLTRFVVSTSLAQNKTSFQIPDMGIKASDTLIPDYLIEEFPDDLIDGEKWGIMKIVYIAPSEGSRGYVEMVKFKPFRPMEKLDIDYFRNCRSRFTLDEWVDVLISAMEYTPSAFASMTQKLEFLTRLLPFIEPRLNFIELAPKGTGKSYVFGHISKYGMITDGGKVTRAKMFYDATRRKPGFVCGPDYVAIDEECDCDEDCEDNCPCDCHNNDIYVECSTDADGDPYGFTASKTDNNGYYTFSYRTNGKLSEKDICDMLEEFGF